MATTKTGDIKNRPLLSVDTAKQSFYDFILNRQVVGYEETEGKSGDEPPTPIVKPVLVHGNYQDIYNKLMNASLVIGAQVSLLVDSVPAIGQVDGPVPPLANITKVFIINEVDHETGRPITIGGMPVIGMVVDGTTTITYLDCLNRVWTKDDADDVFDGK